MWRLGQPTSTRSKRSIARARRPDADGLEADYLPAAPLRSSEGEALSPSPASAMQPETSSHASPRRPDPVGGEHSRHPGSPNRRGPPVFITHYMDLVAEVAQVLKLAGSVIFDDTLAQLFKIRGAGESETDFGISSGIYRHGSFARALHGARTIANSCTGWSALFILFQLVNRTALFGFNTQRIILIHSLAKCAQSTASVAAIRTTLDIVGSPFSLLGFLQNLHIFYRKIRVGAKR